MGRSATNTKQKLIETAVSLIWQNSYASVSVDDICKAANAQKGSFYYYFNSKSALAIEAMEVFYQEFKPMLDDIFCSNRDPIERLDRYFDLISQTQTEIADQYGQVCGCPFASLGSEIAGQDEDIRLKIEVVLNRKKEYFEQALSDMIAKGYISSQTNIKTLTENIHAYILGQMLVARIHNDLSLVKNTLKDSVFNMIGLKYNKAKAA